MASCETDGHIFNGLDTCVFCGWRKPLTRQGTAKPKEYKCPHGKTVDEDCDDCEKIFEESGLGNLLDALLDSGIKLPKSVASKLRTGRENG